jgi:hypothetical protein
MASTEPVTKDLPEGVGVGEVRGGDGQLSSSTSVIALALDAVWTCRLETRGSVEEERLDREGGGS